MRYRRTAQAEADLDHIWLYIATQSGSIEIADRFLDSIVDRFLLLAAHPYIGRRRDDDLRTGIRSFQRETTSSSTGFRTIRSSSCASFMAIEVFRTPCRTDCAALLILRRLLDRIDHQHVHHLFRGLQLQAQ